MKIRLTFDVGAEQRAAVRARKGMAGAATREEMATRIESIVQTTLDDYVRAMREECAELRADGETWKD